MLRSLRDRLPYIGAALLTILVGLAVHFHGRALSPVARDVIGDALWATMIMWWVSAVAPHVRLLARGGVALALCVVVELSQLYHVPWIDALRGTVGGHLVLGNGFDPRDLFAYAGGVAAAVLVELLVAGRRANGGDAA